MLTTGAAGTAKPSGRDKIRGNVTRESLMKELAIAGDHAGEQLHHRVRASGRATLWLGRKARPRKDAASTGIGNVGSGTGCGPFSNSENDG